ncbi:hypothetical protein BCR37DRAFT_395988 [Protomyces lactucae-debilis]|uniref:Uncharacterized protein n=1 Tax=Protomyces lactucae-debilis TaxID=2754530 RepID=A0A1Y2EP73_PROLT|nr:uncharacterized protein BCR37DRAFT_395988 [Protomyces lactucae-debilis]ORY73390.1 hypothetical protein BCR37DRAFT_395988 [Protomyces lactucae-debilis]
MSILHRAVAAAGASAKITYARQAAHIHLFDSATYTAAPVSRRPHSSVSQDFDALLSTSFTSKTQANACAGAAAGGTIASQEQHIKQALKQAMVVGRKVAGMNVPLDLGAKELARLGLFGGAQGRVFELAL